MPTMSAPVVDASAPVEPAALPDAEAALPDGGRTAAERERRRLAGDLPESGVGAHLLSPVVMFVILLVGLAVATAVFLDVRAPAGPSAAVVDAEHRNVDRLAASLALLRSDEPRALDEVQALAAQLPGGGATDQGSGLWVTDGTRAVPATGVVTDTTPGVQLAEQAGSAAQAGPGRGELTWPVGPDNRVELAVYAPIDAGSGPRLWLVSTSRVQLEPAVAGGQGLGPALVLAGLAVLGGLLIDASLVRPQRRLRAAALRIAAGDLTTPAPRSRITELAALARGFDHCRLRLGAAARRRGRRSVGVPASAGVTLAMLAVVGWSVLTVLVVPGRAAVPDQLTGTASAKAAVTAQRAERTLNQGLEQTRAVATSELPRLLDGGRFRGARQIDCVGGVRSAGHPLLDGPADGPDGLAITAAANVPVPTARVTAADRSAVVAEFDVQRLADVIADPPARTRLVDDRMRVVSATDGYRAFEPLADPAARDLVGQAGRAGPSARVTGDTMLSAAPLRSGPAAALGLTVVEEQPLSSVPSSANDLHRRAALLGLLASAVAITVWVVYISWQVRPLRRAAGMADRLCRGDVGTVLYGQHLGPGGTIVSCLDICRRAVALGGADRLGARRPATGDVPA